MTIEARIPPYSEEAEQGVLGSILLDGINALDICIQAKITTEAFYVPAHRLIYEAMLDLMAKGRPIDALSVAQALNDCRGLEQIGGRDKLLSFINETLTAANCGYYAEIVRKKWIARQIIALARESEQSAFEAEDPLAVLAETEGKLLDIDLGPQAEKTNREVVKDVAQKIEKAQEKKFIGIPSVFQGVNKQLLGYDDIIVLAGRPSTGKTSYALNEIGSQIKTGIKPAFVSIESSKEECFMRIVSNWADVSMPTMKAGYLKKDQHARLMQALAELSKADFYITDEPHTIESLSSWARRMKMKNDIGMLWIDYLQYIHPSPDQKHRSREQEVSAMMAAIGKLRKQLRIPVCVLSQLNRAVETGKNPREPRLSDLRDSGAIEQVADVVIFLSHSNDEEGMTFVDIAKARNGPTGNLMLRKEFEYMRFKDVCQGVDDFEDQQTEF